MKWIDLPPVWLLGCLLVAWAVRWPAAWDGNAFPAVVLVVMAAVLGIAAALEFRRARTTIIPREAPSALISGGVFRWTRNPIYVSDLLFLAGASVYWGSALGLLLVPALGWLLRERFILGEEARLLDVYGKAFDDYRRRTRRWF